MNKSAAAIVLGLGMAMVARDAAAELGLTPGWYTIAIAASRNETDQVQLLLTDKMNDPDEIESMGGRTALDYAASFNNVLMGQMLLDNGAHVDMRDKSGNSALHFAAERGNVAIMRFLIERHAIVDAQNSQGMTPLMSAAEHGQSGAVKLLLTSGADAKKQDYTGRDSFGWGVGSPAVMQALNTAH